jgi:hypothetical protein
MARRSRHGKSKSQHQAGYSGGQSPQGAAQRGDSRPPLRPGHSSDRNSPSQHQRVHQEMKAGAPGGSIHPNKLTFQSALQPKKTLTRGQIESESVKKPTLRTYNVIFFDTINQAKSDMSHLKSLASQCDQLNIIVRAEASMEDAELTAVGKLFCGAAWALIHERRIADGWYNEPHE